MNPDGPSTRRPAAFGLAFGLPPACIEGGFPVRAGDGPQLSFTPGLEIVTGHPYY